MTKSEQKKLFHNFSEDTIKGLRLERDAHQFLWDRGYLVFPRIKIFAIRYKSLKSKDIEKESIDKLEVTDLDCYGILFGEFLEKRSFLIDCKHRSENIFSHILRLKGISSILNIDYLLILRDSVPETVQQFADKFDIRLLAISAFRKKFIIREKGSFRFSLYKLIYKLFQKQSGLMKEIIVKYSNCFLEKDPFQRIKQLRILYNELKKSIKSSEINNSVSLEKYMLFQILLFSLVTIAEIASSTIHLSPHHFNGHIELKLIGNIVFKKQLFSKIREIEEHLSPNIDGFNPLKELAPTYTSPLKKLVLKFQRNSKLIQTYLRFNDFFIHEYYILQKKVNLKEIYEEFGKLNREIFGEWNKNSLEILDEEKTPPLFLVKLLT